MRPNSPECILLMLGTLERTTGRKQSKLPPDLIEGLLLVPEDLDDVYVGVDEGYDPPD